MDKAWEIYRSLVGDDRNQSTWGSGPNHGAKTGRVKEYIDFGSKYGFDGVLVEGWNLGWDENWCCTGDGEKFSFYESHPDFDSDEVNAYAKRKYSTRRSS